MNPDSLLNQHISTEEFDELTRDPKIFEFLVSLIGFPISPMTAAEVQGRETQVKKLVILLRSYKQSPPLTKTCHNCHGKGTAVDTSVHYEWYAKETTCKVCGGIGRVPNYLSPRQWEEATDSKMQETDPIWTRMHAEDPWKLSEYRFDDGYHFDIVARVGQPKPPEDLLI